MNQGTKMERSGAISSQTINGLTAKLKEEINCFDREIDHDGIAAHLLEKIEILSHRNHPYDRCDLLVHVLFALNLHAEFPKFSAATIKRLLSIAEAVQAVIGKHSRYRRCSFIYGDLHTIMSRIHNAKGEHWLSIGEHQKATRFYVNNQNRSQTFQLAGLAKRLTRVGQIHKSISIYLSILRINGKASNPSVILALAHCYKIIGDFTESRKAIDWLKDVPMTQAMKHEITWLEISLDLHQGSTLLPLAKAIKPESTLYQPIYLAEAHLLAFAKSSDFQTRLVRVETLRKRTDLGLKGLGFLLKTIRFLEDIYSEDLSIEIKLTKVGNFLDRKSRLHSIEHELFLLAALSRWAMVSRLYDFAGILLEEYRLLNLKLTRGKSQDSLGLLTDLVKRRWAEIGPINFDPESA
jgi:hypothetical protein